MTTSHTLTMDFANILGEEIARSAAITIDTNLGEVALVDLDNNTVRLPGPAKVALDEDMVATVPLIASDSTGTNVVPGDLQWKVRAEYRDAEGGKQVWYSGYFEILADLDLSDALERDYVPPAFLSSAIAQIEALVAEAEAARDDTIDISGISTSDGAVEALVKNTGGAGPLTSAALNALFAPINNPAFTGLVLTSGVPSDNTNGLG